MYFLYFWKWNHVWLCSYAFYTWSMEYRTTISVKLWLLLTPYRTLNKIMSRSSKSGTSGWSLQKTEFEAQNTNSANMWRGFKFLQWVIAGGSQFNLSVHKTAQGRKHQWWNIWKWGCSMVSISWGIANSFCGWWCVDWHCWLSRSLPPPDNHRGVVWKIRNET